MVEISVNNLPKSGISIFEIFMHVFALNVQFTLIVYSEILFFPQMAKKYHPDVAKDPNSQKKFQEISEAYEVSAFYLMNS